MTPWRRASPTLPPEAVIEVTVELGDPILVVVSGVHPIALADAISHAVDAALRLNRELRTTPDD